MKKLILAGAAALFCIGSIAQVQDSASQNLRQAQDEVKDAGNEVKRDAEQTGNEVKQETQEAAKELQQGAERTGEQIQQGAEKTGEQMEQGAERAKDQMDPASQSTPSSNATDMGASAMPPMHEVEVLEDKEGPDHQVIYKYQGELYYVDREQQQLVKIEESQLKDAEHKAIISNNEQDKQ